MAVLQMLSFAACCLVLSSVASLGAQQIPPAILYGTGQQICNYQFAIPNGGNCVTYGPSLETSMKALQEDMNHLRLQYFSQNSVVQEELRKLKQQASSTQANMDDLTKDLKTLQGTVYSLQTTVANNNNNNKNNNPATGNPTTNAMLQQLVTNTRTQLTQSLLRLQNQLNTAVTTVQTNRQKDAVQQSSVDSAFQAQLRQQQQDLTDVLQQLQQLKTTVNNLPQSSSMPSLQPPVVTNPIPAGATSPTPIATSSAGASSVNPSLVKLQTDLRQLDARLGQVENGQKTLQQDIPDLKHNVSSLQHLTANHSVMLNDVKLEADTELSLMQGLQRDVKTNYGAITQQAQTIRQTLTPLKQQAQNVGQNITNLNTQISQLALRVMDQQVQSRKDKTDIADLKTEIQMQARRLTNVINTYGLTQGPRPSTTTTPIVPTPKPHGNINIPTPRPHTG